MSILPDARFAKRRAVIFTGGEVFADSPASLGLTLRPDDLVIAADSGYLTARRFGVKPSLLVGDLDSLDRSKLLPGELDGLNKKIVPAIKDDTDMQLAVELAFEAGADTFFLVGGLGGRLDHTLSSVFLLEDIADKGGAGVMTDGRNFARLLKADGRPASVEIERSGYRYLSLISLTDSCEGVSIEGVFYPLDGVTLTRRYSYAVSNEITSDNARVTITRGTLLLIESRDA